MAVQQLISTDINLDDPSHFFTAPQTLKGEKALWFAVLHDATVKYARGAKDKRRHRSRTFQEVKEWFECGSEQVTSYRWVCTVLGIDWQWLWEQRDDWSSIAQSGQRAYRRSNLKRIMPDEDDDD